MPSQNLAGTSFCARSRIFYRHIGGVGDGQFLNSGEPGHLNYDSAAQLRTLQIVFWERPAYCCQPVPVEECFAHDGIGGGAAGPKFPVSTIIQGLFPPWRFENGVPFFSGPQVNLGDQNRPSLPNHPGLLHVMNATKPQFPDTCPDPQMHANGWWLNC